MPLIPSMLLLVLQRLPPVLGLKPWSSYSMPALRLGVWAHRGAPRDARVPIPWGPRMVVSWKRARLGVVGWRMLEKKTEWRRGAAQRAGEMM